MNTSLRTLIAGCAAVLAALICAPQGATAQSRVDEAPAQLSTKSRDLAKAVFWEQDSRTGKWGSRKHDKLKYYGEGVRCVNFKSVFIGEYAGQTYMFLDFWDYHWRYPNLEQEWMYTEQVWAFLLTAADIDTLSRLEQGAPAVTVTTHYSNMISKANEEYSFPLFLRLTETMRSTGNNARTDVAFMAKRLNDGGRDVVRFMTYPRAVVTELFDDEYFEIDYSDYMGLFTPDKTTNYK
jgi:Ni/Co efflux regulator RcnB